ncbi:MAG: C40 family peptidase [Agathobacter sp.]|nr:C40 family peptidase [Agathobacter sp.]
MNTLKQFLFKHNNFIAGLLVGSLLIAIPYATEPYWATSAQQKKEEAEENLEDVQNEIENIEQQQEGVDTKLAEVRSSLSKLIEQQNILKAEIEDTQASIEQTKMDLEVAKADASHQYELMKIRIRYMYENSTSDSVWMALLESDGITDFLNRLEYVTTIHKADRELTEQYKDTVAMVEEQERQLLLKMDELLVKQETFLGQQVEIETMIADLEDARSEFADALAAAERQADEYRNTIEKQNEIIRQEQENQEPPTYDGGQDVTGQDIVNYAMQFVGNPYVWGGNSLTKGCDCSGFVHLVYKHFGYKTVRYSMSFLYEGVPVSRENVRPGDIVVYAIKNGIGHVAIYAGNGKIVEAQSKNTGITASRSIDCREIVGIRRIIQ